MSSAHPDVLFVPYEQTLALLSVEDAMRVCEDVYRMHARGSVTWSNPQRMRLDTGSPHYNHWHIKAVLLKERPVTGVRLYNYYDDGRRNTVGHLDCTRYIVLSDPASGHALAIVDEHWLYAIRSAAAAVLPLKWLAAPAPQVLGLIGCGTMGVNLLRCLLTLYGFREIRVTSRRSETRERFAQLVGAACDAGARRRDARAGGDRRRHRGRLHHLFRGDLPRALAQARQQLHRPRRELDPADWSRLDKVVVDDWELNCQQPFFKAMVDACQLSRDRLHGEIHEIVSGRKPGRESPEERILIHTDGLVSQDVALADFVFRKASAAGLGTLLPAARPILPT